MTVETERLKEGAALAQSGQFDEARSIFEAILLENPDNTEALFLKGACFYKQGNHVGASESWYQVLSIDPNHAKARGMLAKIPGTVADKPDSTPSAEAPQAKPPPSAKTKKSAAKSKIPFKMIAAVGALVAVGVLAFDMYSNPKSYPFLAGTPEESGPAVSNSNQPEVQTPIDTALEEGLSGKWFFLFEGSPATFNFYPNGRLGVVVNREGGVTFQLDGTYKVEGSNIVFDVNTPTGPEQVTAYNAKISGPNFTFNYDDPDGPVINAERR